MLTATPSPLSLLTLFLWSCDRSCSRDVSFPPVAGVSPYQIPLGNGNEVDIVTGAAWSGLTTFANLPYVSCFTEQPDVENYDIAFLGAPFDTVSQEKCHVMCLLPREGVSWYLCIQILLYASLELFVAISRCAV